MERTQVIWWEMKPDMYAGESCDEMQPRWYGYADGDKEGGFDQEIVLRPDRFPPGTTVVVSIPCCPECEMDAESCKAVGHCEFNWDEWVESEYS